MRTITRDRLVAAIKALGVKPGDGLLVHSALQFLGKPIGGVEMYLEALDEVIQCLPSNSDQSQSLRPMGTLAVPTFNFAFARGEPYDPQVTPSQGMGAFSEYVRQHPAARRTLHPMQSLAVIGRYADDLAQRDTPSAFDPGSAFERMLDLDFKLLLLGAEIQAVSMLHYCEQRARVPYRYWKDFSGLVKTPNGWERRTYRMFVRDLELNPQIELYPVQALLQSRQQWHSVSLNYGHISSCRLVDFVAAVDEFLGRDPWSLVVNRPQ
jgi:aminoglycoside 3-N-acetyltransferase